MHEDRERLEVAQHIVPIRGVGRAAKDAGLSAFVLGSVITANAGKHVGLRHGTALPD